MLGLYYLAVVYLWRRIRAGLNHWHAWNIDSGLCRTKRPYPYYHGTILLDISTDVFDR